MKKYPIHLEPNVKAICEPKLIPSNCKKGISEPFFYQLLRKYLDIYVYTELSVADPDKINFEYTPDAILKIIPDPNISEFKDMILIDIEVDEPYTKTTSGVKAIHIDDSRRDSYFLNKGWHVIRFTEEQIIKQPFECVKYICMELSLITNSDQWSAGLECSDLMECNGWNQEFALNLSKSGYRNSYLCDVKLAPNPNAVVICDGIYLQNKWLEFKRDYSEIYKDIRFDFEINAESLIGSLIKYVKLLPGGAEFTDIEFKIYFSLDHSIDFIKWTKDIYESHGISTNIYIQRAKSFICFDVCEAIKEFSSIPLIVIADGVEYRNMLDRYGFNKSTGLLIRNRETYLPVDVDFQYISYVFADSIGINP